MTIFVAKETDVSANVTITQLNRSLKEPVRRTVLKRQKGIDDKGAIRILYRLDASSAQFDVQFTKAFRLSVAQARKENKATVTPKSVAKAAK